MLAYNFVHVGVAIITEIAEEPLATLVALVWIDLAERERRIGAHKPWDNDSEAYCSKLEEEGYRAWSIGSAIGFEGYVIAKAVSQKPA